MVRHPHATRPLRALSRGWGRGLDGAPFRWVDAVGSGLPGREGGPVGPLGDGGRGFASRPRRPGRRGAPYRARTVSPPTGGGGPKGPRGAPAPGGASTKPPEGASRPRRVWGVEVSPLALEAPRSVRRGARGAPKGAQKDLPRPPRPPKPRGPHGPRGPGAWRGRMRRVGRRLAQVGRILRSVPRGFNPFGAGAQAVPRARASDPRFWEGPRGVDRPGPHGGRPGGGGGGEGVRPGPLTVDRGRGRGHGLAPVAVFRQGRARPRGGRGGQARPPRGRAGKVRSASPARPFKGAVPRGPRRDALGVASPAAYGRGFSRRYGYARFPRIPRAPRHGRRVWPPRIPPRWVRPAPPRGAWDPGARGAWVPIVQDAFLDPRGSGVRAPRRPPTSLTPPGVQDAFLDPRRLLAALTRRAHAGEAGPVGLPDDGRGAVLDRVRGLPRALVRWAWVRRALRRVLGGADQGLESRRYAAWASRRGPWDRPWWARWLGLWLPMRAIPRTALARVPKGTQGPQGPRGARGGLAPMEEAMGAVRSHAPRAAALRAVAHAEALGHARRRLAAHRAFQRRRGLGAFGPWAPRRPRGRPRGDTAWWGGVRRRYRRALRALRAPGGVRKG